MMGVQHKLVGVGVGVAGAYLVVAGKGEELGAIMAFTSTIGCMLPDIDHDNSKIGRKRKFITSLSDKALTALVAVAVIVAVAIIGGVVFGFINDGVRLGAVLSTALLIVAIGLMRKMLSNSKAVKWMTKHRGIMHTLIPVAAIVSLTLITPMRFWFYSCIGLALGYVSHLFADMLTVEGCPILYPLSKKNIHFLFFRLKTGSFASWVACVIVVIIAVGTAILYVNFM